MVSRLALPLALTGRGLAAVPQDSPAEVSQSVALLLATRPGERRSIPEYGTEDPLFSGLSVDDVTESIGEWEDRADPALVELIVGGIEEYAVVQPGGSDGSAATSSPTGGSSYAPPAPPPAPSIDYYGGGGY